MENVLKLILDCLYCLVALCVGGFFVAMIYTDIKKDQRDEIAARNRTGSRISSQTNGILSEIRIGKWWRRGLVLRRFSRGETNENNQYRY